ncbi:MAG: DUF58 domain-containing protein, partial [Polyangiaceae bacterium]|nr:DUF58 domain-containing protein [Polyangiaceae bacterium]
SESRVLRHVPALRGLLRLTSIALRTRYPFGLIEKGRVVPLEEELLVYPSLVPVGRAALERMRDGDESASRKRGSGSEIIGVRAYREHDDAREIHWRKSASAGALVVREREGEARSTITILLDNRRPSIESAGWEAELERAISEAASLADLAASSGIGVEVVTASGASPRVAPCAPLDPLLRFLALLEPASSVALAPDASFTSRTVASNGS